LGVLMECAPILLLRRIWHCIEDEKGRTLSVAYKWKILMRFVLRIFCDIDGGGVVSSTDVILMQKPYCDR
jgi:hypothetical protein